MSWSGRTLLGILRASAVVCVVGLVTGPEFVFRRLAESMVAIRKTVGDSIVRHDIASLSRQLDEERDLVSRMRIRRNALVTRLQDRRLRSFQHRVEGRRQDRRGPSVFVTGGPWDEGDHEPESDRHGQQRAENDGAAAWADDAIASIAPEIKRLDRQIETVESALQVKECELFVLEATAEARRIHQELAGSGEPLSWSARVARLSEFLQPIGVAPNSN